MRTDCNRTDVGPERHGTVQGKFQEMLQGNVRDRRSALEEADSLSATSLEDHPPDLKLPSLRLFLRKVQFTREKRFGERFSFPRSFPASDLPNFSIIRAHNARIDLKPTCSTKAPNINTHSSLIVTDPTTRCRRVTGAQQTAEAQRKRS